MLRRPQHYSTAVFRVNSIHNYINDIHILDKKAWTFALSKDSTKFSRGCGNSFC
jgi:hypothetical protein